MPPTNDRAQFIGHGHPAGDHQLQRLYDLVEFLEMRRDRPAEMIGHGAVGHRPFKLGEQEIILTKQPIHIGRRLLLHSGLGKFAEVLAGLVKQRLLLDGGGRTQALAIKIDAFDRRRHGGQDILRQFEVFLQNSLQDRFHATGNLAEAVHPNHGGRTPDDMGQTIDLVKDIHLLWSGAQIFNPFPDDRDIGLHFRNVAGEEILVVLRHHSSPLNNPTLGTAMFPWSTPFSDQGRGPQLFVVQEADVPVVHGNDTLDELGKPPRPARGQHIHRLQIVPLLVNVDNA